MLHYAERELIAGQAIDRVAKSVKRQMDRQVGHKRLVFAHSPQPRLENYDLEDITEHVSTLYSSLRNSITPIKLDKSEIDRFYELENDLASTSEGLISRDSQADIDFLVSVGLGYQDAKAQHGRLREYVRAEAEKLVVHATAPPVKADFNSAAALPTELPSEPPAYRYQPRMTGGIERYLRDNFAAHIEAGLLTRPDLKRIDKPAYFALNNFLKGKRKLPDDLQVPDRSQAIDAAIRKSGIVDLEEAARLASALARRASRKRPGPV